MYAVVATEHGGPEVLVRQQLEDPSPGPAELLVRLSAAGVNYIDTYERSGLYPFPVPAVIGKEGAGEVVAIGPEVADVAVGDHVAWSGPPRSYAELVAVPARDAVPIPAGLGDELAAALMLQGMTAQYLAADAYPVRPGDWVVVHAAAGGVGLLLTQLVKARGGHVVATTGGGEKAELARGAGADVVVGYDQLAAAVAEATGGEGAAGVYDGVGASTFDASLAALRPRGTLVLYGGASGPVPPVDPMVLNRGGSLYLTRPTLAHFTRTRAELLERAADVMGRAADGSLDVRIGGRYPAGRRRAGARRPARRGGRPASCCCCPEPLVHPRARSKVHSGAVHEVTNQVPPLVGHDLAQDPVLLAALAREGGSARGEANSTSWAAGSAPPRCRTGPARPTRTSRCCGPTTATATASTRSSSTRRGTH